MKQQHQYQETMNNNGTDIIFMMMIYTSHLICNFNFKKFSDIEGKSEFKKDRCHIP